MIEDLKNIEKTVLMDLLKNPSIWNTLDVNYHQPRVERLWTQIGTSRLMLHVIHTCETDEALYHPHPWPSAMHVLSGSYEMGLGVKHTPNLKEIIALQKQAPDWDKYPIDKTLKFRGYDDKKNIVVIREIAKIIMDGDNYYEMLDPKGWHYVRPITSTCLSIMLIDEPWEITDDQDIPKAWGKLPTLTEKRKIDILLMVRADIEVKLKIYG